MSKVDALRALREARFAAAAKAPAARTTGKPIAAVPDAAVPGPSDSTESADPTAAKAGFAPSSVAPHSAPARKTAPRKSSAKSKTEAPALYVVPDTTADPASDAAGTPVEAAEAEVGLCGHRSMGGKSCSRPAGHSEKNHRYK